VKRPLFGLAGNVFPPRQRSAVMNGLNRLGHVGFLIGRIFPLTKTRF
jgi:hypothetical protein